MDEKNAPNQEGLNINPDQPTLTPPPAPAPTQPAGQKVVIKKSPWPWIVGGCLFITILAIGSIIFLGWWGAKKVKNEINKYEPTMEDMKNNLDRMNREAEEWDKKSQEFQESMPESDSFSEDLNATK